MGFPLAVMHTTSLVIWATCWSFPSLTRVIRYRTRCSSMVSPLEASASKPSNVRTALSTISSSPDTFKSVPRLMMRTLMASSILFIFSSKEPKTAITSSKRSALTIRSITLLMGCSILQMFSADHLRADILPGQQIDAGPGFPNLIGLGDDTGDHLVR